MHALQKKKRRVKTSKTLIKRGKKSFLRTWVEQHKQTQNFFSSRN